MLHHLHGFGFAPSLIHFLHTYRLGGLFLLLIVEEAGVPIPLPGDMLVALAGAQPHMTVFYIIRVLTASTLAVFIGSSLLYWAIRRGGRPLLLKWGRFIRLRPERLERIERWFVRYGAVAIVVGRLIPGLRVPTAVMAGLTNVPYRIYAPATAFAALVWSVSFFWLGDLVKPYMSLLAAFGLGLLDSLEDSLLLTLLVVALLAIVVAWGWRQYHVRRRLNASSPVTALGALDEQDEANPEQGANSHPTPHAIGNSL